MREHRRTVGIGMWLLVAALGFGGPWARADFYVTSGVDDQVLRYDDQGNFIGVFVTPRSGGLNGARGLAFGPDGNLYVGSVNTNQVMRYNGTTGAFMGVFVTAGSGGLNGPEALVFPGDGDLYISNFGTNPPPFLDDGQVTRYLAASGTFDSLFVSSADTRANCDGMIFGPNGNLFITCLNRGDPDIDGVLEFDGSTGQFVRQFTQGAVPPLDLVRGVAFDPAGNLYVTDISSIDPNGDTRVARFDPNGQYIDDPVPFGSGLYGARQLAFGPDGRLYIASFFLATLYDGVYVYDGTSLAVFIDGNQGSALSFPVYFTWQESATQAQKSWQPATPTALPRQLDASKVIDPAGK